MWRQALSPCVVAVLLACRPASSSTAPSGAATAASETPAPSLAQLGTEFFEGYFARDPVGATAVGEHRFDGAWPDLSPAGRAENLAWIEQMLLRLDIPRQGLSADEAIDLDVLVAVLEGAKLSEQVERPWMTNPLAYVGTIGSGLDDLIMRDFAPVETRASSLAQRLEGVPALVDQALANLSDPAQIKAPHAKVAVAQLAGLEQLVREEIPARTKGASEPTRARIAAATPAALEALSRLATHVREQLLPGAQGPWRIGPEAFSRKLALTLQTDLSAEDVYARAKAEHEQVRARMATLARELYVPLLGAKKLAQLENKHQGPALEQALVRQVLSALAADHVEAEKLRDAAEENLLRLSAFVTQANIVPLDAREQLSVIWTPPHERGVAIAGLDAPPPLDARHPGLPSFYLVQPVPEEWSKPRRESFLREYNHFMLEILSIHEAIPGHFVQLYYAKREPSMLRKVFSNGPFVEGWAVYTEHLMVQAGYAGQQPEGEKPKGMAAGLWAVKSDPALRAKAIALHGQKFYLRTVTNAILDHEIHAGDLDEEAAVAFMVDRAFQEEGEARAKWVRAQLSSTQLSTYFVGATAWFRLREQAEAAAKQAGKPFVPGEFHARALSHGAPPVHRLPELGV